MAEKEGFIKFYRDRYGFIQDPEGRQYFLHWTTVEDCGIDERSLTRNKPVKFIDEPSPKGRRPEVKYFTLLNV